MGKEIFKIGALILLLSAWVFVVLLKMDSLKPQKVIAAVDSEIIDVNLDVSATIANACTTPVNMGGIIGTGQSALTTNETTCNIVTNNTAGYSLTYTAATAYLENANGDQIAAYTPAVAGTPEPWSVASAASEWGARLKRSGSTTYDNKWGTTADDTYGATSNWHNVTNAGSFTVVTKSTETTIGGDNEIIQFGAEVGSGKLQPTGAYDVDVTITATTL